MWRGKRKSFNASVVQGNRSSYVVRSVWAKPLRADGVQRRILRSTHRGLSGSSAPWDLQGLAVLFLGSHGRVL